MGTWDIGHFDNDTAADFAGELDDAAPAEREAVVRAALALAARSADYLDSDEGAPAVAAAALVAAQCPGGEPVSSAYGPKEPLPVFGAELRPLALEALARVLGEDSELRELWSEAAEDGPWQRGVEQLRTVLRNAASAS